MLLLIVLEALLLGGAALLIFLAVYVWRQKATPAGPYFCVLVVAIAAYSFFIALELLTVDLHTKLFWSKLQYIPGVSLAPLWFLFAMAYGGYQNLLTRRRIALLWVIPMVALAFTMTNERHNLVWYNAMLIPNNPYGFAHYDNGPVVYLIMYYTYALMAVASSVMVWQTFRSASMYRGQTIAVVIGVLLPWLGNIIAATGLGPLQGFEAAAIVFVASATVLSWTVLRFHLFEMTSVAYDTILASMDEAVVIVDEDGRLAYLNAAAKQLLAAKPDYVDTPLAKSGPVGEHLANVAYGTSVVNIGSDDGAGSATRHLEVTTTDLRTDRRHAKSGLRMLMVRDITARTRAEEELARGRESMREFNRSLTALNQVSNELASVGDLDELCKRAVELGRQQLGFDRLGIWFVLPDGEGAQGAYGTDEHGMLRDERDVVFDRWYKPSTEWHHQTDVAYEHTRDVEFVWRGKVEGRGDRVVAPMWDGKHIIGYLCADNLLSGRVFSREQCQILALLANSLGRLCSVCHAQQEQRGLEAELHQAQKMEAIGQLAGGVAHDFNNMLAVVLGYTEMAMKKIDTQGQAHGMLLLAHKAIQRSSNLTRQLLAFARKEMVVPRLINLNETVSGTLKMLQRLIGDDIRLAWKPGTDLWSTRIDPAQVDQILINLLVNARDAINGAGLVTIETDNVTFHSISATDSTGPASGEYVLLAMSDSGAGMDKVTCERIFEPFFTTKEVGKGTGLGLSIVYGIVKQNGGLIDVYSEPGAGTTFRLYFPRAEEEPAEIPRDPAEELLINGNETILMVEDEPAMLSMGEAVLEELGYTVLAVDNPHQAIELAREREGKIDLLITDVVMPGMNGRELAAAIETVQPGLKCLYVSGYASDVIAKRGILNEGVDFLHKPFSLRALAEKVRMTLNKQRR